MRKLSSERSGSLPVLTSQFGVEIGISPIFSFLGPGLSPQPSQDPESLEKEQETQSPRSAWARVDTGGGVGTEL